MSYESLRKEIKNFLNVSLFDKEVEFQIHTETEEEKYTRFLISYTGDEGMRSQLIC